MKSPKNKVRYLGKGDVFGDFSVFGKSIMIFGKIKIRAAGFNEMEVQGAKKGLQGQMHKKETSKMC